MQQDWSPEFRYCIKCYKTAHRHILNGICKKCYNDIEYKNMIKETLRKCLKCDKEFSSKGLGNRRCDDCLRQESNSKYPEKYRHKINIR